MPSRLSDAKADELASAKLWKGTATDGSPTKLYINGEWITSTATQHIDLFDPVSYAYILRLLARCTPILHDIR
jgi:hypothetical protein